MIFSLRELETNNLPILLVLFPSSYVKNTRRCPASPAFFALQEEKIPSQNLGSLFITNSLTWRSQYH
ncbi:hypothetical protein OAF63_05905, partial [Saprospiraceae bacterium]|nr:hypothetical protein [Saprospiraceae bacterium]